MCPVLPPFSFDSQYCSPTDLPLNSFLPILNAHIKLRRYSRTRPTNPLASDVKTLIAKTFQLVALIYWKPPTRPGIQATDESQQASVPAVVMAPDNSDVEMEVATAADEGLNLPGPGATPEENMNFLESVFKLFSDSESEDNEPIEESFLSWGSSLAFFFSQCSLLSDGGNVGSIEKVQKW